MQLDGASTVEELKMAAEQLFGLQPGEVLLLTLLLALGDEYMLGGRRVVG